MKIDKNGNKNLTQSAVKIDKTGNKFDKIAKN